VPGDVFSPVAARHPSDSAESSQRLEAARSAPSKTPAAAGTPAIGLSPEQLAAVAKLAAADRRVRSHEQAHLAVAGPYATGGPSYSLVRGPDGIEYAVAGDVSLDTSPVPGDPEATIQKARTIEAAANAPVDPSTQDRMVAAEAASMEQAARQELAQQQQAEARESLLRSAYPQHEEVAPGRLLSLEL